MKYRYQVSFLITLVIYSSLFTLFFWVWQLPAKEDNQQLKPVAVKMAMFQQAPPVPVVEPTPPPKEIPKKIEPQKPVEKPRPKPEPKPVVKPKPKEITPKPLPPKPKVEPIAKPIPKEKPKEEPKPEEKIEPVVQAPPVIEPEVEPLPEKLAPPPAPPKYSEEAVYSAEQNYLNELATQLANYAQDTYPKRAKRRHWEGVVHLSFTLYPDGSMHNIYVIKPSEFTVLDEAALSIIHEKMAGKFKPFPEETSRKTWQIQVPIDYQLR